MKTKIFQFPSSIKKINTFFSKIKNLKNDIQKQKIKYVFEAAFEFYNDYQKSSKNVQLPKFICEQMAAEKAKIFTEKIIEKGNLDYTYKVFKNTKKMVEAIAR